MMKPKPNILFDGKICFSKSRVACSFDATGDFHDALLWGMRLCKNELLLEIRQPFFPREQRYAAYGLVGAKITLKLCDNAGIGSFSPISKESIRNIYWLKYDLERECFNITVEELYDFEFSFVPQKSTFRWLHRKNLSNVLE